MSSDPRGPKRRPEPIHSRRLQREDVERRRQREEEVRRSQRSGAERKREGLPPTLRRELDLPPQGESPAQRRAISKDSSSRRPKRRRRRRRVTRPPLARSKQQRISRQALQRRRRIRLTATLIILGLGLSLALLVFLPAFYLEEIEVRGLRLLTAEEVVAAADLTQDNHLFSYVGGNAAQTLTFRYGDTETRLLERIALIDEVTVRPKLPSRVVITIEESVPLAFLDNGNVYAMADASGRIIATSTTKPAAAPLIQGVSTRRYEVGDRMITDDVARLEEIASLTDAILALDREAADGHSLMEATNTIRRMDDGTDLLYIAVPRTWLQTATDEPASTQASDEGENTDVTETGGSSEPTTEIPLAELSLGEESERTVLFLVRIDRGAPGREGLRWFRNALIEGRLEALGEASGAEAGDLAFPGMLDLSGEQRSYRPDVDWPK